MNEEAKVLFRELAEFPPPAREAYYTAHQVSAELRAEVESLLEFDKTASDFFTAGLASVADDILRSRPGSRRDGDRCGPYRVVRLLGHGGMGAVYLGERTDGEVEQHVAIKFLRAGADLPSFRERFLQERQILASLNHPGIARLIDAGHTDEMQPYLVMEYINGTSIDVYCASKDLKSILSLFVQVADVISYAHRNLIIHRDLKPSNILVDGAGRPKLLDFGIAKVLDAPDVTRTMERLLTPDYASPEQHWGEAHATSTDIYSLGAVLYRLVTGRSPNTPFDPSQTRGQVREFVPPSQIKPGLPKDLDFILQKALRQEPDERYASADAFSQDVRAFLESRPVQARKGNAWYHTRKFLRRYWLPATAGALAVIGLSVGLFVANRERAIAHNRFQQVRQLANELLALDTDIRTLPGATKARHRLVSTSLRYLERLGPDALNDMDLALEIGSGYLWVGRAQGVPTENNLGQMAEAEKSLTAADRFVDTVLQSAPANRAALLRSAEIGHDRMILAESTRRPSDAMKFGRRVDERLTTLLSLGEAPPAEIAEAASLLANVALAHQNMHSLEDSVRYARRAADLARDVPEAHSAYSINLSILANSLRYMGDLDGALRNIREARKVREGLADSTPFQVFAVLWREGVILGESGGISLERSTEAADVLQKAYDLALHVTSQDRNDYSSRSRLAMAGRELGDILRQMEPERALKVYDQASQRLAEIPANAKGRSDNAGLLAASSYPLRALNRTPEAKHRLDEAFALLRTNGEYPSAKITAGTPTDIAMRALGDYQEAVGLHKDATATYQELLGKVQASSQDPKSDLRHANSLSQIYQRLAQLYRKTGQRDAAVLLARRQLNLWQDWDRKLPSNPFVKRRLAEAARTSVP